MAIEGISISTGEVSKTSSSIRTINNNLGTRLQDIKKQMNDLEQAWKSDAGSSIRSKFNALAPKFENYRDIVDSYAKFLDATVTNYETVEAAINNNANAFK